MATLAAPAPPARVVSVDIFRGLTMAVMIFVNQIAGVHGLPWWNYHMSEVIEDPAKVNGMTYVDVVFPAFLFILGMAIPLAAGRRFAEGTSQLALWGHILARAVSLVVLGLLLANAGRVDAGLTGLTKGQWACLALLGAVLLWHVAPRQTSHPGWHRALRLLGLALLVAMFALFRRTSRDGHAAWLDFGYWEILGLIGRAYLAACILYLPLRRWRWTPAFWFVILTAANICSRLGWTPWLDRLPYAIWIFEDGALPSIAMAGILCGSIYLSDAIAPTLRAKLLWGAGYAAVLYAAGWAAAPLGISKNAGTPAWCLLSSAISATIFLALYWIADVRGLRRWAAFVQPAGSNTLLTYLVPDFFYFAVGLGWLGATFSHGAPGVALTFVFTAAMLAVAALLTRWGVRMRL
jgi:predicted acyltransferase